MTNRGVFVRAKWAMLSLLAAGSVPACGDRAHPAGLSDAAARAGGSFRYIGSMTMPRARHSATLLPNGKMLIAGGGNNGTNTAELFDPATGTSAPTGTMSIDRFWPTAVLLPSGKVLVVGASNVAPASTPRADLYDPSAGAFSPVDCFPATTGCTVTLMPSQRVLVTVGGAGADAYLYDPVAGTCPRTGSLSVARSGHTATLLSDGTVLMVAGRDNFGGALQKTADRYDPVAATFSPTGELLAPREWHTATLLPDGRALILGGHTDYDAVLASAETYDPAADVFRDAGNMTAQRYAHTATLLPNGKVLITGGLGYLDGPQWSAEIFDPTAATFTASGNMVEWRAYHTATLLPDGRVLIAGGRSGQAISATVEIWSSS